MRIREAGRFTLAGICDHWSPELFEIAGLDPAGRESYDLRSFSLTCILTTAKGSRKPLIKRMLAKGLAADDTSIGSCTRNAEFGSSHGVGEPVYEEGLVTRFVGTTLDITEQERLTQELQRREAYLAQAEALSRTGSFGWNVSTGDLYWSDETFGFLSTSER